ncbi:MAG: sigma 54-interacting transcriptional regulator [Magnetococcales bacterium]|nr:sigma 54-interacting transcriptional regulator [Magnetococcales bacterium]
MNPLSIVFSWIGTADLESVRAESKKKGSGPLARLLREREFHEVHLLAGQDEESAQLFSTWLGTRTATVVTLHWVPLADPGDYGEICRAALRVVEPVANRMGSSDRLCFHLENRNGPMTAIWILLAKAGFPQARLLEVTPDQEIRDVSIPFSINTDMLPDLLRTQDQQLIRLAHEGFRDAHPEFNSIACQCEAMRRVVEKATLVAARHIPVLIQGESGTGKELLARAIHNTSPFREGPFVAINCGAIPDNLVESELFGHEKGAFTGALTQRKGFFAQANGGTVFLDEIGELPLSVQVKLLRVLQEQVITPVGSCEPLPVKFRLIAATNKNLLEEMVAGRFREDLFHRIAVALLLLPPLRTRGRDIELLTDRILEQINQECREQPGFRKKSLTENARKTLQEHRWPGNIRELQNTLHRAAVWTQGEIIRGRDIRDALLPEYSFGSGTSEHILNRPMGAGFRLTDLLTEVADHYIHRAIAESHNNKAQATRLVGLPNATTFANWTKKYPWDQGRGKKES